MPSPPQQLAVTMTFDLHNLNRLSVGVKLRYRVNKICLDKRTNMCGTCTAPKHNVFAYTVECQKYN